MPKLFSLFSPARERRLKPAAGFGLTFVVLVLGAIVSIWNATRVYDSLSWVAHTHEVLTHLQRCQSAVRDVEAQARGFAITGEDRFLEPYLADVEEVRKNLALIRDATRDNASQQRRLEEMGPRVREYFSIVEEGIDLRRTAGLEAARQFIMTDKPRQTVREIHSGIDQITETEHELLAERNQQARKSYWTAVGASLMMVALAAIAVGAAYVLVRQELATRLVAEAELRSAQAELENRVQQRTAELSSANNALHQEVGERTRAEAAIRVQEHQLRVYAHELERSNQELEQFAAVASHDLQEPLRKIQTFGDRLKTQVDQVVPDSGADYLARIMGAAGRMRALIDDLLTYSRVTRRARVYGLVDLGEVANDVVTDLDGRLQLTGGRVEIGPLPTLEADKTQMRQLLQNVIANALKFRKPDEPPVVQIDGRLDGVSPTSGPLWEIQVRDNGIGFENEYRDRIFGMFERLHGRNEYEGTGMGLAICRRIVEGHGGSISAQSAQGQGATIQIRLPVRQPNFVEALEESPPAHHDTDDAGDRQLTKEGFIERKLANDLRFVGDGTLLPDRGNGE